MFQFHQSLVTWLVATASVVSHVHSLAMPRQFHPISSPQAEDNNWMDRRQWLQTTGGTAVAAASGLWLPPSAARADDGASTTTDVATTANDNSNSKSIVTLQDGSAFPLASFGLQIYNDETAYRLTLLALEVGYRNFFASVLANNQRGFAKAVRDSGIPREQLYICGSVVSNRASGFKAAQEATTVGWKRNLEAMSVGDITYLDQIMLDYPGPDAASIQGQWAAFQSMKDQQFTKSLSVSNFSPAQLDAILNTKPKTKPVVNQLPYSVAYHPGDAVAENTKERGVLVQAWAPLGKSLGGRFSASIKSVCADVGKAYNKSWAQVALRWIVQSGAAFTTCSQTKEHFQQDLNIFDFTLTDDDMETLYSLAKPEIF